MSKPLKNSFTLFLLLIRPACVTFAQSEIGTLFLTFKPGARANAMGGAQAAIADDIFASYYNPAGLANAEDSSSSKINAVPIVAFGLGGFILGGIIGAQIDQGGPFEITKAERTSIIIGTAVGMTVGYILAKRDQRRKQKREKEIKILRKEKQ